MVWLNSNTDKKGDSFYTYHLVESAIPRLLLPREQEVERRGQETRGKAPKTK